MPQNAFGNPACFCVGGVCVANVRGHREVAPRDRAEPDFMAALAFPHEPATAIAQQPRKLPIQ
jgi:hypothetical protein